jgi:hypothetical protein
MRSGEARAVDGIARSAVMRIDLRCEVRDEHFPEPPSRNLLRGVCKTDLTNAEFLEDCADLRHIVERQYELAFQFLQAVRHDHEVVVRKVVAVEGSCVIRRIEVEECLWPVVFRERLFVREALNLHTGKARMGFLDEVRQPFGIEARWLDNAIAVMRAAHESRVAVLDDVEISCRPLNIRKRCGVGGDEVVKPCPARDHVAQVPEEFLVMQLANAVEVDDIAVEIVQHLHFRWLLVKEHLCASGEPFHVRGVLRECGNELLRNRAFAPDVGQGSNHAWNGFLPMRLLPPRISTFMFYRSVAVHLTVRGEIKKAHQFAWIAVLAPDGRSRGS